MKQIIMIFIFYCFFLTHRTYGSCVEENPITPDHIDAHCYYLTKLTTLMHLLPLFRVKKPLFRKIIAHILANGSFNHPLIHDCLQKTDNNQSLRPLHCLWTQLNAYNFINDEALKKEFCILIILLYKNIITHLYMKEKKFIIEHINTYYGSLSNKNLDELIEIITIIAQELKPLLESMHENKTKTWKAWILKYWAPIVITCITIAIKIKMREKRHETPENKIPAT